MMVLFLKKVTAFYDSAGWGGWKAANWGRNGLGVAMNLAMHDFDGKT
jgi:hypothetical protein